MIIDIISTEEPTYEGWNGKESGGLQYVLCPDSTGRADLDREGEAETGQDRLQDLPCAVVDNQLQSCIC